MEVSTSNKKDLLMVPNKSQFLFDIIGHFKLLLKTFKATFQHYTGQHYILLIAIPQPIHHVVFEHSNKRLIVHTMLRF